MMKRLWMLLWCLLPTMTTTSTAFVVPRIKQPQGRTTLRAKRVPRTARTTGTTSTTAGPKGAAASRQRPSSSSNTIKRAPHQFDHTKEQARPFVDVLAEITNQKDNEDAPAYALPGDDAENAKEVIRHAHFCTFSLDELFPNCQTGISETFARSTEFRTELRNSMREDIFDTTPTYHGMSAKARQVLLLPDSSLQGSWKCTNGGWSRAPPTDGDNSSDPKALPRMQRLTETLRKYLGETAPTGDEFMDTIGALCGSKPSTHWIDIVGVLTRRIPHSWHQDTGNSPQNSKTVLLGFPPASHYDGVGVFSHLVKLEREQWAGPDHPPVEPVLYTNEIPDAYIVRPRFAQGRELIVYRDVDVLHSSPDVAHRMSVMRFM